LISSNLILIYMLITSLILLLLFNAVLCLWDKSILFLIPTLFIFFYCFILLNSDLNPIFVNGTINNSDSDDSMYHTDIMVLFEEDKGDYDKVAEEEENSSSEESESKKQRENDCNSSNEEPEYKKQRESDCNNSNDLLNESSSESSDSNTSQWSRIKREYIRWGKKPIRLPIFPGPRPDVKMSERVNDESSSSKDIKLNPLTPSDRLIDIDDGIQYGLSCPNTHSNSTRLNNDNDSDSSETPSSDTNETSNSDSNDSGYNSDSSGSDNNSDNDSGSDNPSDSSGSDDGDGDLPPSFDYDDF
jgi:hypothetical protein